MEIAILVLIIALVVLNACIAWKVFGGVATPPLSSIEHAALRVAAAQKIDDRLARAAESAPTKPGRERARAFLAARAERRKAQG